MWERKYFNTYGGLPGDLIISDIIPEILRIRDWRVMLDARGGGGGPGGNDRWWMTTGDRLADTHIAWRTKDRGQKKELFGKDKDIPRRIIKDFTSWAGLPSPAGRAVAHGGSHLAGFSLQLLHRSSSAPPHRATAGSLTVIGRAISQPPLIPSLLLLAPLSPASSESWTKVSLLKFCPRRQV